jgi:hypothetical protein
MSPFYGHHKNLDAKILYKAVQYKPLGIFRLISARQTPPKILGRCQKCLDCSLYLFHHAWLCLSCCVGSSARCSVGAVAASAVGAQTVAAVQIAVYARVGFVCQVGVVGSGIGVAHAGATSVVVTVTEAGMTCVEVSLGWVRHQVAVVGSWRTVV